MNNKNNAGFNFLYFACLLNLLVISSSYAEVKSGSQLSNAILTESELSQCHDRTKLLAQTAEQLKERLKQLKTLQNNISKLEQDREQGYQEVDFHSQISVDKYNQINKQIKQLSQEYTQDAEHFNKAVKQYNADIDHHVAECDDKKYFKKTNN